MASKSRGTTKGGGDNSLHLSEHQRDQLTEFINAFVLGKGVTKEEGALRSD